MRDATFYVSGLVELHERTSAEERRAAWRQSMAALGRMTAEGGPGPLEGLHPEALRQGVRLALQLGLVDDLDWLAPAAAGAALFELASALPIGPEQRELGRRVWARLVSGDAETFVAIAHRMAMASPKGLNAEAVRARVGLVVDLPLVARISDGPLALAIAARRESARPWIAEGSTGSLPSRRLAARLIERAAREAAKRAARGDEHSLRVFRSDAMVPAWRRLLGDRESLVWRHLAVARGLLAPFNPEDQKAIEEGFAPSLSPTEWRRAATSAVAFVAVAPEEAVALVRRVLSLGILERDPGAASAFLWGLPRAADAEVDAAGEVLDLVLDRAGPEVGEAVIDLRAELGASPFADRACARALELYGKRSGRGADDGAEALEQDVARDLRGSEREDLPLRDLIARALQTFVTAGARDAQAQARQALGAAQGSLLALEAVTLEDEGASGAGGAIARRTSVAVLRDLDVSLLEGDVLYNLLALGGPEAARGATEALDGLRDRLCQWIIVREGAPQEGGVGAPPAHPTIALRRLRALLHLVDGDVGDQTEDAPRAARLRRQCMAIVRTLLVRVERGPPPILRRTVVATLARALDALVRVGACDVVDVMLAVATKVSDPADLGTLAEASMDPDLVHVLRGYARFAAAGGSGLASALSSLEELTREIAPDGSGRMEAVRTVLVRLSAAMRGIFTARGLMDLPSSGSGEAEAVAALEGAIAALSHLVAGARGRLDLEASPAPAGSSGGRPLTVAVERVLSHADASLDGPLLMAEVAAVASGLPDGIARLVRAIVEHLLALPMGAQPSGTTAAAAPETLPTWLPVSKTIGGFHVLRSLGAGAGGSVFVVTRVEDKNDPAAEKLALKVPEYSATAARSLSETEFLKLFRSEASALIALPQHPNLARFVTFDAGSKPKPILVMELVEGITLERILSTRRLSVAQALRILDDVLAGLEAMHAAGVAHLDIKPSNVVLREAGQGMQAVLVDFGLAGRHIRPGCATGPYGAPEVWGALDGLKADVPAKADMYAFACVAFETLTGRVLFDAESEVTQVAMHVAHDGYPLPLRSLAKSPWLGPLVELLFSMLRRNPEDRIGASKARAELSAMAPALARCPWPVDAH